MLLQFKVNNFRSVKDTVTFSMATATNDNSNFFTHRKYELLQSAVVYGANASGKSNILKAMMFMRNMVLNKDKVIQSTDRLRHDPFRLNTATKDASSSFEIVFFIDQVKYRYGFEADERSVYSEWLYEDSSGRKEARLFYRDSDEGHYVNKNRFKEGYAFFDNKNKKIKVAQNKLFLWKCDEEEGEIAQKILMWFSRFNLIDGLEHRGYEKYTMEKMDEPSFKDEIVKLVKTADIGIEDIGMEKEEVPKDVIGEMPLPVELKQKMLREGGVESVTLNTYHKLYDEKNNETGNVEFDLENEESIGTQKFFKMSAPILNTLQEGKILMIDELDASLHPVLTKHLIKLFHDKSINTKNAQLIFATHDTNLLKPHIFRRDQVWLTEKDRYGATDIYSLAEFKGVRKSEDFEKQYIQGKYGAIPYIGKFEF